MVSIFIILINFLFSLDQQFFKVDFLGLPAASVHLNVKDTLYNQKDAKLITFNTESVGLINYFFHVDNNYKTIISKDSNSILSFQKSTKQPNIINQIETSRLNQKTLYNNSSIIIPPNSFNIFSLLYFLSNNKITKPQQVNIEREGVLYIGKITPIERLNNRVLYDLELLKNDLSNNNSVIDKTDIFTWAVFQEGSEREIWIDYDEKNIMSCVFKIGKISMRAQNQQYIK